MKFCGCVTVPSVTSTPTESNAASDKGGTGCEISHCPTSLCPSSYTSCNLVFVREVETARTYQLCSDGDGMAGDYNREDGRLTFPINTFRTTVKPPT